MRYDELSESWVMSQIPGGVEMKDLNSYRDPFDMLTEYTAQLEVKPLRTLQELVNAPPHHHAAPPEAVEQFETILTTKLRGITSKVDITKIVSFGDGYAWFCVMLNFHRSRGLVPDEEEAAEILRRELAGLDVRVLGFKVMRNAERATGAICFIRFTTGQLEAWCKPLTDENNKG